VKEQARLQQEGQQRLQKRQKRQRSRDWVGHNFEKQVKRFQENDQVIRGCK